MNIIVGRSCIHLQRRGAPCQLPSDQGYELNFSSLCFDELALTAYWSAGTPSSYDAIGDSGKVNKHFFCPTCGSNLYTELEVLPDNTCIKAGSLDNGGANLGGKVDIEFYCKDRNSYLTAMEGAKQEPAFG